MESYSNISDNELLSLLNGSDHVAYTEIFYRYFSLIFIHAQKKLRDEELAKDVTQEVFISLWHKRASGEIESNLAGYLYTSARNRIFNLFAHEQVKGRYLESLGDYMDAHSADAPDYRIREQQMQDYIDKQIHELPPKMRRIFEMSRKEHLSHREIAEELGVSQDNVSKQVTNALRILRTKLGILLLLVAMLTAYIIAFLLSQYGFVALHYRVFHVFTIVKLWVL